MAEKFQKLGGIQIARAVAALSVCYFHSWTILDRFPQETSYPIPGVAKYGWLGVDLFFGISGFVICLVVTRPTFRPTQFAIRRVFRLYPLWILTLSLFALMAWCWRGLLPTETIGNFLYSATLLPTQGFPFYDIGWSLQHEMAFYLIAIIVVPVARVTGLIIFLCISTVVNQLVSLPWYFSQLASYHPEFLVGVVAFLLTHRLRWTGSIVPIALGTGFIISILASDGPRWLFPAPLFFFIVGFANLTQSRFTSWIVPLGDSSYSIYLIHPLVFAVAKSLTKLYGSNIIWIEEPLRFSAIGIVIMLSLLSWRFFEKPMIEAAESVAKLNNSHDVVAKDRRL